MRDDGHVLHCRVLRRQRARASGQELEKEVKIPENHPVRMQRVNINAATAAFDGASLAAVLQNR